MTCNGKLGQEKGGIHFDVMAQELSSSTKFTILVNIVLFVHPTHFLVFFIQQPRN